MVAIFVVDVRSTAGEVVRPHADVIRFANILHVSLSGQDQIDTGGNMPESRWPTLNAVAVLLCQILPRMVEDRHLDGREVTIKGHR